MIYPSRLLRAGAAAALLLLGVTPASADPDAPVPPVSARAPEVRLSGKTVTLPLVMIAEYPFVDGAINGVSGKLMLDTGYEGALTINDHRVPVTGGRTIGTGFFGSGQTFAVQLLAEVANVRIGAFVFPRVTQVTTQDARLLESITPDFLGWLGHHAFASHAMKMDYRALEATFYEEGPAAYLAAEQVLAELPFETRRLPNHPILPGRIGDLPVVTTWDTGQYGSLYTTEGNKARLIAEGRLTPSATDPDVFDLAGVEIAGHVMPVIPGIDVVIGPSHSSRSTGITETEELVIGYALLRQFKSVWDYRQNRLYLLAP